MRFTFQTIFFAAFFALSGCGLINGISNGYIEGSFFAAEGCNVVDECSCSGSDCICDADGFGFDIDQDLIYCACIGDCESTCDSGSGSEDCDEFADGTSFVEDFGGLPFGCACRKDTLCEYNESEDICIGPPGSCVGSYCEDFNIGPEPGAGGPDILPEI